MAGDGVIGSLEGAGVLSVGLGGGLEVGFTYLPISSVGLVAVGLTAALRTGFPDFNAPFNSPVS